MRSIFPISSRPRHHIIVQAQNGSGKTICFLLGSVSYIDENVKLPQVLILVHARELALQIAEVCRKLVSQTSIECTCALKGIPFNSSAQVVIGSTDSVKNAVQSMRYNWSYLKCLVIDEADHVLEDRHFAPDIRSMVSLFTAMQLPLQILLFSATFNEKVMRFARSIAPQAIEIRKTAADLRLRTVHMVQTPNPSEK